jgi:hypothetical protein
LFLRELKFPAFFHPGLEIKLNCFIREGFLLQDGRVIYPGRKMYRRQQKKLQLHMSLCIICAQSFLHLGHNNMMGIAVSGQSISGAFNNLRTI